MLIDALAYPCGVGLVYSTNSNTITENTTNPNSSRIPGINVRLGDDGDVEADDTYITLPFDGRQLCVC
jgi:hypothetical protein